MNILIISILFLDYIERNHIIILILSLYITHKLKVLHFGLLLLLTRVYFVEISNFMSISKYLFYQFLKNIVIPRSCDLLITGSHVT